MQLNARHLKLLRLVMLLSVGSIGMYVSAQPTEQVIKVVAKKFDYTPNVIHLKKNVPVVLEFTSEDVVMGFYVPDLKLRADIIPGMVTRLRIVPDKVGRFVFVCDIFCGSGHEDMTGAIVVSE
jgi:cytochrome c oxidase subunit II